MSSGATQRYWDGVGEGLQSKLEGRGVTTSLLPPPSRGRVVSVCGIVTFCDSAVLAEHPRRLTKHTLRHETEKEPRS